MSRAKYYCGIDFGTTNSSVALARDGLVRVLDLDPVNDNPASLPSLLYITNGGKHIVGRAAADAFIDRNVDREVQLKQVDLGVAIEAYVGGEPDKSETYRPPAAPTDIREGVRAHATVEVNSPGRLFQSLKTQLRHAAFRGTEVFGTQYQIEELVASILRRIKETVDHTAGHPIESAVFGRPVRFSTHDEENDIAQRRLETAARLAGFKDVVFFYEPVGACVEYALTVEQRQRLMVVDIGGGTCDVCVMEFGGAHGAAERLAESRILGVSGVPVAGDAIDREIIKSKLFPIFGSRARYGPSKLRIPQYIYNEILDWQNLYKLNTEEMIHWFLAMEADCTAPEAIRALRLLIQRNYGYPVAREVESAKKRLSWEEHAEIRLQLDEVTIHERLEREEFTHIIEYNLERMMQSIEEAEAAAQLRPQDIDLILTTGGTSLIPAIRHMLAERFGSERLLPRDTFTSVATGLATVAQYC
ncbi:MAG: Hsp70 family protein [Candidatus Hydrogenedentes bacterium]|nr:Hsp70 family protein [Candidatus Hydrogenedentota bacterium]